MRYKRGNKYKSKIKLKQLYYCLACLFVISFVITGVSFSRFSTTITSTGALNSSDPEPGQVPVIPGIVFSTWAMDYGAASVSLAGMAPGDTKTVNIWVSNKDSSGTVSGYNQNVTLEIKTTINLPLNFTLKRNGSPVVLNNPDPYRYVSEIQAFRAGVDETKSYVLTISWPGGSNHLMYRNELDYIELRVKAVQA
ncbi:MAG: hypothetical protein BWY80_01210 [Firmicutes bacterium ADurb.Bin456]|nr:MAG: hypothetical protein BWY80_01210 [Firmicutes bacterium ADurb.Bin456]